MPETLATWYIGLQRLRSGGWQKVLKASSQSIGGHLGIIPAAQGSTSRKVEVQAILHLSQK
jgi:hypothetical protein